jgi:hypothetical protein
MAMRSHKAIAGMLATASQPLSKDPQLVASMLADAMAGVSRRLLESGAPEKHFEALRRNSSFSRARTLMRVPRRRRFEYSIFKDRSTGALLETVCRNPSWATNEHE